METQPTEDYIIPDEDSIFSLLPDGREVIFSDLGGLRNFVQEEIAVWTNVENTIANRYKMVLSKPKKQKKVVLNLAHCLMLRSFCKNGQLIRMELIHVSILIRGLDCILKN